MGGDGLRAVPELSRPADDARVRAVLEVLAGERVGTVARRWSVDVAVLHRWVTSFVEAGTARVTNTPDADEARKRDRFLAAFAHETRTPLAIAQGWTTMLLEDELPPAVVARTAGRLHEALGRLADRSRDVELMVATSLGLVRLERRAVSVSELAATLEPVPAEPPPDVVLDVDPELFGRMVRDLWREAHAATPQARSVHLEVLAVGVWTEVRVVRTGGPVDHAVLRALFEPFDLNDDATGVTLGLYLARALAVLHGGSLGLDQDDESTVFWVRVPTVDPRGPSPAEVPSAPSLPPSRSLR